MVDTVFSAVRMPSSPFIQVGKFAPITGGKIYIGKQDTDPTKPENQVQVFMEQEDLSLTPIPQPIIINESGYPEFNGIVGRFVTQVASSMAVYTRQNVLQYYFDNLLEYDAAQMWKVIQSPTGWEYIGTAEGSLKSKIQGFVTPWDFVGRKEFTSVSQAIQAMFDYAQSTGKVISAYGWKGTLESTVNAVGVTILGGTWQGTADVRLTDTLVDGAVINNLRFMHWGGNVRVRDCLFDGKPTASKVGSFVMQGVPVTGTIEIEDTEFRNGLYGILQQGTGEAITRGVYRNLSFYDMSGDGIELNVINRHYDNGCLIDGIFLDNLNGTGPSWGIGVGVAGVGPYGWDQPDTNYCKNITIRNVFASRVRQIVHLEMARDCTVENIHGDPNQNVSNGSGLTLAAVVCYGCKRITIDGVTGEPVVTGNTDPNTVRIVMLEWGVTAGAPSNPCFDMTVRNVKTITGRVYAGVAARPDAKGKMIAPNRAIFENIECNTFSLFGVASELSLSNVHCSTFDAIGDDSGGGTTSNGQFIRSRSILNMVNVTAYDANGFGGQGWRLCRYTDINSVASNVFARMYSNIIGGIGVKMINSNHTYVIPDAVAQGATTFDFNAFPTGREFMEGDLIVRGDGKIFTVITTGSHIPATDAFKIAAASAGATTLTCNVAAGGTEATKPWLTSSPLTAGCRINIPGAGPGGAVLRTVITQSPYQTPPGNISAPVTIDIADPIVTAVPAGTQLSATFPISFRTPS